MKRLPTVFYKLNRPIQFRTKKQQMSISEFNEFTIILLVKRIPFSLTKLNPHVRSVVLYHAEI